MSMMALRRAWNRRQSDMLKPKDAFAEDPCRSAALRAGRAGALLCQLNGSVMQVKATDPRGPHLFLRRHVTCPY
jgi:hypothetical protein